MAEAFLFIVTVLLAIIGLGEFLHWICYVILKPKKHAHMVLVVYLTEDDAECQMLAALEELRWHGKRYADSLVAVTENISDEKKAICRSRFCGKGVFFTESVSIIND